MYLNKIHAYQIKYRKTLYKIEQKYTGIKFLFTDSLIVVLKLLEVNTG